MKHKREKHPKKGKTRATENAAKEKCEKLKSADGRNRLVCVSLHEWKPFRACTETKMASSSVMPLSTKRGLGLVFGEGDREGDVMRLGAPHGNSYPMASCYSISYEEIVIVVSMRRSTEYNSFWGQVMGTLFSVFISAGCIPQTDLHAVRST